jgi:hypothetical protein
VGPPAITDKEPFLDMVIEYPPVRIVSPAGFDPGTAQTPGSVRLGDVPAPAGSGVSKSAASRHFVALSSARMKDWMGADLSGLDIMVVQIDGIHITEHLVLVAAIGIDGEESIRSG